MVASLHAIAQRHVHAKSHHDAAVDEIRRAATQQSKHQRAIVRTDLLAQTAGAHLGYHQADRVIHWEGEQAAQLLIAAGGTDQAIIDAAAAATYRNLVGGRRLSS